MRESDVSLDCKRGDHTLCQAACCDPDPCWVCPCDCHKEKEN